MEIMRCTVRRQLLDVDVPTLVALTYDYINVKATFSSEWAGMQKWLHIRNVEDQSIIAHVLFNNDEIGEDVGLNLSAGEWDVWIHGALYEDNTLIKRITTNVKKIRVEATGTEDEILPSIGPSVAEQAVAAAERAETAASTATSNAATATTAAQEALNSANSSATSAEQALAAVSHYPHIVDNEWIVWDAASGEWVNTGIDALGCTFTPHVSDEGVLSWTNNGGLPNPESVNLLDLFVENVPQLQEIVDGIVADAQDAVDELEAQRDAVVASVAAMIELGTDTTLTVSGMAADALATGNLIRKLLAGYVTSTPQYSWVRGTITGATGANDSSTTRLRSDFIPCDPVCGFQYTVPEDYQVYVYGYETNAVTPYVGRVSSGWTTGENKFTNIDSRIKFVRLVAAYTNSGTILVEDAPELEFTTETPTDYSLSLKNKAADAKVVGDWLNRIGVGNVQIGSGKDLDDYTDTGWYWWLSSGNPAHNPNNGEAGTMQVYGTGTRTIQIVWSRGGTRSMNVRFNTTTGWTEWKKLIYFNDLNITNTALNQTCKVFGGSSFSWEVGKNITTTGVVANESRNAISDFIEVSADDVLIRKCNYDADAEGWYMYIASYDATKTFISRVSFLYNAEYIVPDGVKYIRIVCALASSSSATMSVKRINNAFKIGYSKPYQSGNSYVAIGASTSIGAIHTLSDGVTYTTKDYPNYVATLLNKKCINVCKGSTGFVARDSGTKRNFMDTIMYETESLADASLVTIMFGYGNDRTAGLPIGEWNDYYPFDESGYGFTGNSTTDAANVTAMIQAGATLYGCLNWCIKWIGEHYPKAELIVIFGAPSLNAGKTSTVEASTDPSAGTQGYSPYKITASPERTADSIASKFETLKAALNIPFINLQYDGLPFSYYSTYAKDTNGMYSVFSTVQSGDALTWNGHPNEAGYDMYARFIAGKILSYYNEI